MQLRRQQVSSQPGGGDGSQDEGSSNGSGEKWVNSRYLLEIYSQDSMIGYRGKGERIFKGDSQMSGLSSWMDDDTLSWDEKERGGGCGASLGEAAQSRGQAMRYAHLELRRELSAPISRIDDIRGGGFKDKCG